MAEKQNKNMIIGVAVAAVVLIVVVIAVLIVKGNGNDSIDSGIDTNGGTNAGQIENNTTPVRYDDIDVSVEYGDYEEMFAQSKSIQNGEMLGKIVKIDGIVSHPMSNYSIGQEDENGSFVGTQFVIEGAQDGDYPEDGDHVVITGEVVENSPMYFVIRTSPQYVEILEEDGELEEDEEEADELEADE